MNTTLTRGARFTMPESGMWPLIVFVSVGAIGVGVLGILQAKGAEFVASKAEALSVRHASAASEATGAPMREVHIANNGAVLLRGATITSISGSDIGISMEWGSSDFSWKIHTDSDTKFLDREGEKSSLDDLLVGDNITISGSLSGGDSGQSVDAQFVHQ